jgi:GNAT superfamily N-acetyltransferase
MSIGPVPARARGLWEEQTAHLSVLAAPGWRGQGPGRAVASRAVAHALGAGLLPQWRARPVESRRVAAALGFRELGAQLSFKLA